MLFLCSNLTWIDFLRARLRLPNWERIKPVLFIYNIMNNKNIVLQKHKKLSFEELKTSGGGYKELPKFASQYTPISFQKDTNRLFKNQMLSRHASE